MNYKGFFGIGIWGFKHDCNIGTLFRSAVAFDADFIFTVGRKYSRQGSDTVNSIKQIPYYQYLTGDIFTKSIPRNCKIVCIELAENAVSLPNFIHPGHAVYLLGNEGSGIPARFMQDKIIIQIPTKHCLNVSTAGTVVMYDRVCKQHLNKELEYEHQANYW